MLPPNVRALLTEVVSHRKREHQIERDKALQEFTFKMANQGLSQSSAFNKGKTEIYCEAFAKYATSVWNDMQRVLDGGFATYPGCEDDLINFLKESLAGVYEADTKSLNVLKGFGAYKARFEFYYQTIAGKLATEIKIFANKLRTIKEKEVTQVTGKSATPDDPVEVDSANDKGFLTVVRDGIGLLVSGILATLFFSTAHIIPGFWCSFVGLATAFHIPFQHYANKNPLKRWYCWICYGILLFAFFVWFSSWSFLVYKNSQPSAESKAHPYFSFSLRTTDQPSEKVKLTNDFLIETNFSVPLHLHPVLGALIVPLELGQSNVTLTFFVKNESPSATAEDAIVTIRIPKKWEFVPDANWTATENDWGDPSDLYAEAINGSGVLETITLQKWTCNNIPVLLPGCGVILPSIQLHHVPSFWGSSWTEGMTIMVRAKDSPTDALSFALFSSKNSIWETNDFHKPIVVPATKVNGKLVGFSLSPKQLKELQK
jgi:hypothetical protein